MNARPLIHEFFTTPAADVSLSFATPSTLIGLLHVGTVDVALASSIALFSRPAWTLVPGPGIVAAGPVMSVRLLSRVPFAAIRTLALDAASCSSNALARILLAEVYGVTPAICTPTASVNAFTPRGSGEASAIPAGMDAAVVIGDAGLCADGTGLHDLDLGQAWWDLTGLPFVFAGWLARDAETAAHAAPVLQHAAACGLARRTTIAEEEAERRGIPVACCRRYLTEAIHYTLDDHVLHGLAEFRRCATALGLVKSP